MVNTENLVSITEANDEDLLNLSKRIIEKIERSMADRTSYFKESEEERNEMCEAMEKLIKEERSEERARPVWKWLYLQRPR